MSNANTEHWVVSHVSVTGYLWLAIMGLLGLVFFAIAAVQVPTYISAAMFMAGFSFAQTVIALTVWFRIRKHPVVEGPTL